METTAVTSTASSGALLSPAQRLLHWTHLPVEIQQAVYRFEGRIEMLQMNFDELIPTIEPPRDAMHRVLEAVRVQESYARAFANGNETFVSAAEDHSKQRGAGAKHIH